MPHYLIIREREDVYVFWFDEKDRVCKHFKSTVPTDTASSWTRSAFWGGAARFVYSLGDGFQPEDLAALAGGYWLKQYHDEMHEDLRLIKGSMNVLGAPESPEEEAPDDNEDL